MTPCVPPINLTTLAPSNEFSGEDRKDHALLAGMVERAHAYLRSFDWCGAIVESYIDDIAIGGVVAVLLIKIQPAREEVDEWLRVVVGDLPPAYLVTDDTPDSARALEAYVDEMRRWVDAVKSGSPVWVWELIPVEAAEGGRSLDPTVERAEALEQRLRFLEEQILPQHTVDVDRRRATELLSPRQWSLTEAKNELGVF